MIKTVEYLAAYARVSGDDYNAAFDPFMGGYGTELDPDDGLPISYPGERGSLHPVIDVVQYSYRVTREYTFI